MRPYQLLPFPAPAVFDPGEKEPDFFYNNFVKPFIPDMLQMMDTGLHIDQDAVEDLRVVIGEVLQSVAERLEANPLVQRFQEYRLPAAQQAHKEKCTQAVRTVDYYLRDFNPADMTHRTWVVNTYLIDLGKSSDMQEKWPVRQLKKYNEYLQDEFLEKIIAKRDLAFNTWAIKGMRNLAEYKLELWNRPRYEKAEEEVVLDPFNPGSTKQVRQFFEMLNIAPLATSKDTGEPSWGRDQIEELLAMTSDAELKDVLLAFVDASYSGIIKTNFLKAFDTFTIDGVLHGNIKLFGAKSFRNTSNRPNLFNAPSTGSIYAKPLKRCFRASDGRIIYAADLAALEDRVMANLSKDPNKLALFLENLDGHSMSATYYFRQRVEELIGSYTDNKAASRLLKQLVDDKNKKAGEVRQDSKPVSFGLAYGAFPPKVAATIKSELSEGERIFNIYHHELYPGITDYRENYVLNTARQQGYIHLGLGCRMYTKDPDQAIRTLANGTVQFWSILTLIAINEFNHRIREAQLEDEVKVISSIYDSVYTENVKDPEILKWVNDNLIEVMCVQYLEDEIIHNEAQGEIGPNWADLHSVPNNASVDEIRQIMEKAI